MKAETNIFQSAIEDFDSQGYLKGENINPTDIEIEFLDTNHEQPTLPKGKVAVLLFFYDNHCLLTGFVGAKSKARFQSQHYKKPRKDMKSLAGHLLKDQHFPEANNEYLIGQWIKENCWRVNYYIDGDKISKQCLQNFNQFLRSKFQPRYGKR